MPLYQYKASRLDGKLVRGQAQAISEAALHEQLSAQSLYLLESYEKESVKSLKRLSAQQLSDFCRELGAMLGAGVPLIRALSIMADRDIKTNVKEIYNSVYRELKRGCMLSEAMRAQEGAFPDLLISMLRASEASGQMDVTCKKMAEHYSKSNRLNKKVRSALTYPIVLCVVTLCVVLLVFLVVLPKFFQMFESMNAELPGITRFMLGFSRFLKDDWLWLVIGVLALVLIGQILMRIPPVRIARDRILLRVPIAGKLLRTIYTARFARTLSSCYSSGISIVNALLNTRDTVGNAYIASQFPRLISDVRSGRALSEAVRAVRGFDSKLSGSILIGEETGRLYDMLESTAEDFDYESEMALGRLVALVEPVMIIVLAVVIGTIMISVILPLTTLYGAIGAAGGL